VCPRCGDALNVSPTMSISSEPAPSHVAPTPAPAGSPARGFAPGSMIADRYRVASLLGRGGMGEVYGAEDLKLGQRVALKFLPANRTKDSAWREQFYAEVRIARQISHPNVCRVYDIGESDGRLFLSMEFVDGEDLASLLRRIGRLPDDKAVEVAQQLCAGLAAAHATGVLHRDLKPANVMLDGKGRARITDFGLAIAASDASGERAAGTPGYMAPELFGGAPPTVQSDLYALGLVLYEVFTGKKAFDAPNLAELYRKQSETNPTPPSSVVKNLDPAVERAILRCLDRDPTRRPRTAHAVAAALPGGDPLAAALAAGETPSPDMVAAAGPQGSLKPAIAWGCLIASIVFLLLTVTVALPRTSNWGRTPMPKSPEVLADRAQELAQKLGYSGAIDQAYWIELDQDYQDYISHDASGKNLESAFAGQVWPSPTAFWFRQSPQWIMPAMTYDNHLRITSLNPPYDTSGMVTLKLDMLGRLLFLRAIPSQVEVAPTGREPDWNLLFAEAGLDKSQFAPGAPKWAPPDRFDASADWDGHVIGHADLPLHVTAAAWRGKAVYFQVIAPWDRPWQTSPPDQLLPSKTGAAIVASLLMAYVIVGGFFARRNIHRGRADIQGAVRFGLVLTFCACAKSVLDRHFVPVPAHIWFQFYMLAVPILISGLAWIGYMAAEPYARRMWPEAMVSWQRLLNGRLRDPLIGRDLVLGILSGSALGLFQYSLLPYEVRSDFGRGIFSAIGDVPGSLVADSCLALLTLGTLAALTGLFRRRWLGMLATGTVIMASVLGSDVKTFVVTGVVLVFSLFLLTRVGLLALVGFMLTQIMDGPPLVFSQWYAGRAMIGLIVPLGLLIYGFWVSLGGRPILGGALREE
jgi:predicted Ser/Thr protein kinase